MKHPFDVHVGARLRQCRRSAGLSRRELAAQIGLRARELQRFEEGAGRIDASLLRNVVAVTGASPAFFFEGLAESLAGTT